MKSFLQIENLTKSFGDRVLISDVTFGIYEGDKIGLIAKNGSGKTTLLRIIAGEESYDSGSLVFRNDLRVGYLKQLPELDPNLSVSRRAYRSTTSRRQPYAPMSARWQAAMPTHWQKRCRRWTLPEHGTMKTAYARH